MIGPGMLVAVVGPSGAGKDTLIDLARADLRRYPQFVFPKRTVTRPASSAEDHETLSVQTFDACVAQGGFAFWWEAHGQKYGLPVAIEDDVRQGRAVVCNISRAMLPALRARYARGAVVLVTAPADVLRQRLAARARPSDGDLAGRVNRSAALASEIHPDLVIENIGEPIAGARTLSAFLLRELRLDPVTR